MLHVCKVTSSILYFRLQFLAIPREVVKIDFPYFHLSLNQLLMLFYVRGEDRPQKTDNMLNNCSFPLFLLIFYCCVVLTCIQKWDITPYSMTYESMYILDALMYRLFDTVLSYFINKVYKSLFGSKNQIYRSMQIH